MPAFCIELKTLEVVYDASKEPVGSFRACSWGNSGGPFFNHSLRILLGYQHIRLQLEDDKTIGSQALSRAVQAVQAQPAAAQPAPDAAARGRGLPGLFGPMAAAGVILKRVDYEEHCAAVARFSVWYSVRYIYIYIFIYIYTHTHRYTYVYIYIYRSLYMYTYMYWLLYFCM